jgi:uncharacterized membrane protein
VSIRRHAADASEEARPMTILILGLVLFLGAHSVPIFARPQREALVSRFGLGSYRIAATLVSLVGLYLIVIGYAAAREAPVVLWDPPPAMRHIAATLMLFAFPILFSSGFHGRIRNAVKHPMLVALKLWAFSHLLANGTLADVVLFGGVLAWAVVDRISVKRRGVPDPSGGSTRNDVLAVVFGLATYVIFVMYLHEWLFGVAPFG